MHPYWTVLYPTEVCETEKEEMFDTKLESIVDQPLVVVGDFSTIISTDWADYEMCIASHGFDTKNNNSTLNLDLAGS